MMRFHLRLVLQVVMIMQIVVTALPVLYFIFRMNDPLPQPEFNGLSFIEYQKLRRQAEEESIARYITTHPNYEYNGIGTPLTICYTAKLYIVLGVGPLQSFGYTLAGWAGVGPDSIHPLPERVTIHNFLPKWWETFEFLFWYNEIYLDGGGPAHCLNQWSY